MLRFATGTAAVPEMMWQLPERTVVLEVDADAKSAPDINDERARLLHMSAAVEPHAPLTLIRYSSLLNRFVGGKRRRDWTPVRHDQLLHVITAALAGAELPPVEGTVEKLLPAARVLYCGFPVEDVEAIWRDN
ncbi:hypothetical protein EON67_03855 [archaeon]|nr:MAG: hypothetical protein EON67_03855 [archaeon]